MCMALDVGGCIVITCMVNYTASDESAPIASAFSQRAWGGRSS
jgi:hypothetical protein